MRLLQWTLNTVGWAKERTLDDFLEINVFETEPKKPWLDAGRVVSSAAWKSLLGFNAESYCTSWSSPWFGKKKAIACACAWDDVNFLASATIIVEIPHSISFKWDPNQDYYPSFLQSEKRLFFSQCLKFTQKVLSTYKILQRSRRHSTFRPFCFWLAMPKFTHSTADFYQNSPQIFTKHGRFSSFWKGNYQTLCFLFRRQKCWTFFMTRRRLSRLFERES